MRRLMGALYVQVLLAIALGVAIGHFWPDVGTSLKPLGDGFIKLVKMVIAPIIFCTVVAGIASMDDLKKVGRVGVKALFYFEVVTTLALVIGLVAVNVIKPGVGINADPAALDAGAVAGYATVAQKPQGIVDVILGIIPTTVVGAFAQGEILQVLFFAVLFGFALAGMGKRGAPLANTLDQCANAMFGVVAIIMRLAPLGALGAIAFAIGAFGFHTLGRLMLLMVTFYVTCLVFIFGVLGLITWLHGFSIWRFLRYIREEILIVLGTSSSESVLPRMMVKMEHLGCAKPVVGLVIPTGYSFNLDGTSIYLTMAAIFIAQACNITLSWTEELTHPQRAAAHVEGRGGGGGRRVRDPGGDARVGQYHSGGRPVADPGHRPLHGRGPGHHQSDRERRGHGRDLEVGRRTRRGALATAAVRAGRYRRPRRDVRGCRRDHDRDPRKRFRPAILSIRGGSRSWPDRF